MFLTKAFTASSADSWVMKTDLVNEEWRDLPGFEGLYQVSNLGFVRSLDRCLLRSDGRFCTYRGRVLSTFQGTTCNYKSVLLSKEGVPSKHMVHRLVAIVFLGLDPNSEMEVNHKDGNRHNNRASNLEVVTHQQNIDHSVATGLKDDYGEKHVHAKFTNQQAEEIRQMWRRGVLQKDIAEMYGVHKQTICSIVNYKTYIR